MMDQKGRCCGRKPILYKRGHTTPSNAPHFYCTRCDKSYAVETKEQLENWAYKRDPSGEFLARYKAKR